MKIKTAIITGASSGIGKAVAIHLAQQGYTLLLIARNQKNLMALEEKLEGKHQVAAIDVADAKKVNESVSIFLEKFHHVDILFNSAGYVKRGTTSLEQDEFLKMINTNLVGTFNLIKAVVPCMKEKKSGYIMTVASHSGKQARAPLGGYAASKFGVVGLCEALYKELANTGISVTTICPNLVDTEMTADVDMPREQMLQTSDIVKTVDYLLSLSPSVGVKEIILQCKARVIQHEMY